MAGLYFVRIRGADEDSDTDFLVVASSRVGTMEVVRDHLSDIGKSRSDPIAWEINVIDMSYPHILGDITGLLGDVAPAPLPSKGLIRGFCRRLFR